MAGSLSDCFKIFSIHNNFDAEDPHSIPAFLSVEEYGLFGSFLAHDTSSPKEIIIVYRHIGFRFYLRPDSSTDGCKNVRLGGQMSFLQPA